MSPPHSTARRHLSALPRVTLPVLVQTEEQALGPVSSQLLVTIDMEKAEAFSNFFASVFTDRQASQVFCFPERVDGGWGIKVPPTISEEQFRDLRDPWQGGGTR